MGNTITCEACAARGIASHADLAEQTVEVLDPTATVAPGAGPKTVTTERYHCATCDTDKTLTKTTP
jgi:hypothetical protein